MKLLDNKYRDISEYMKDYKEMLAYLLERKMLYPDNLKIVNEIIRTVRRDFFRTFSDYVARYFYDFDECYGHSEDSETFTFDNHTKAIRKFNDYYYIVKIEEFNTSILRTECPDDYPLHIMPQDGELFPEYIIADYLIKKGF